MCFGRTLCKLMHTSLKLLNPVKRNLTECATLVLLAVLYVPLLLYWLDGWLNKSISIDHEYYSYAIIGFPYAAIVAWQLRHRWNELPDRANFMGLSLLVVAGIFYLSPVQEFMNLSMPIVLVGIALLFKGWKGLKLMAFPLLFVALATPTAFPYLVVPYLPTTTANDCLCGWIHPNANGYERCCRSDLCACKRPTCRSGPLLRWTQNDDDFCVCWTHYLAPDRKFFLSN